MRRRSFLKILKMGSSGLILYPVLVNSCKCKQNESVHYCRLKIIKQNSINLPDGKRTPFGWPSIGIAPNESIIVKPENKLPDTNLCLRVSVAQEIRDEKLLHVKIPETDNYLGVINICFSSVLVPYELKISSKHCAQISENGLELKLESKSPIWIFSEKSEKVNNEVFLPNVLCFSKETGTVERFLECFSSINSVQAFGWREGTVLDGLWQLYTKKGYQNALDTIEQHFNLFFNNQNLCYEDGRSNPVFNAITGIESTLPFATLARLYPNHPILKLVVESWNSLRKSNGAIVDGDIKDSATAEGCYTIAYPMAVIGKLLGSEELQKSSLFQLKHRFILINNNKLWLRYYGNGQYSYPNWARGAAWTLLGFIRTMSELNCQDKEIINKFREGIKIALSMQRVDGLWNCFMDAPKALPDTSGSAGIAAAIITGVKNGYLPGSYEEYAFRCWNGLQKYITVDGFLKGAAQDNRGGIALQESDYRVIAQMGMGLMAQLHAYL